MYFNVKPFTVTFSFEMVPCFTMSPLYNGSPITMVPQLQWFPHHGYPYYNGSPTYIQWLPQLQWFLSYSQVYGLVLSCMMYRDGNTTVAAMETMNSLLLASSPALSRWLMTAQPSHVLASKFWMITNEGEVGGDGQDSRQEKQDSSSDAHSLREVLSDFCTRKPVMRIYNTHW